MKVCVMLGLAVVVVFVCQIRPAQALCAPDNCPMQTCDCRFNRCMCNGLVKRFLDFCDSCVAGYTDTATGCKCNCSNDHDCSVSCLISGSGQCNNNLCDCA